MCFMFLTLPRSLDLTRPSAVEVRAVAAGFSPSSFLTRHFGIHPCQVLPKKVNINQPFFQLMVKVSLFPCVRRTGHGNV